LLIAEPVEGGLVPEVPANLLYDGGTVFHEVVVQSQDEFLIELVAIADRSARRVPGLAGLPGRHWRFARHQRISRAQ
jgi:hypothetical protein